jgi:hypothetical protein
VEWLPQLKSQQVRIQQVLDDSVTPRVVQERIKGVVLRTTQIAAFDTTEQFTTAMSGDKLLQWMKDRLRPASLLQPATQNSHAASKPPKSNHDN